MQAMLWRQSQNSHHRQTKIEIIVMSALHNTPLLFIPLAPGNKYTFKHPKNDPLTSTRNIHSQTLWSFPRNSNYSSVLARVPKVNGITTTYINGGAFFYNPPSSGRGGGGGLSLVLLHHCVPMGAAATDMYVVTLFTGSHLFFSIYSTNNRLLAAFTTYVQTFKQH